MRRRLFRIKKTRKAIENYQTYPISMPCIHAGRSYSREWNNNLRLVVSAHSTIRSNLTVSATCGSVLHFENVGPGTRLSFSSCTFELEGN